MSKKDRLLQEIGVLRETRKDWFTVMFALASAIVVLVYAVVSGDKPVYLLLLSGLGFMALMGVILYYKNIEHELANKLAALEKED